MLKAFFIFTEEHLPPASPACGADGNEAQKGIPVAAVNGDTVQVHYTGTLSDGSIFDTSAEGAPIEFTIGSAAVIPGFETAVVGMQVGESKTFTIPSGEAYGERDPRLVQDVPRSELPPDLPLFIGMRLTAQGGDGREIPLIVT